MDRSIRDPASSSEDEDPALLQGTDRVASAPNAIRLTP